MSAGRQPWTLREFLEWERQQPQKYEFDGVQPIPVQGMAGGTRRHARIAARLIAALAGRLPPECEVFGSDLKMLTNKEERSRYPASPSPAARATTRPTWVEPIVVFEVLSPSTSATDFRTKLPEYRRTASVQVVVHLDQDQPVAFVWRRATGLTEEPAENVVTLPEIGVDALPLAPLQRR